MGRGPLLGTQATRSAPRCSSGRRRARHTRSSGAQTRTEGNAPPQSLGRARPGENCYRWRTRRQPGTAAVRDALEKAAEQTSGILQRPREAAEEITASARQEADETTGRAKAEAAEIVVNASTRGGPRKSRDGPADRQGNGRGGRDPRRGEGWGGEEPGPNAGRGRGPAGRCRVAITRAPR